MSAPTPEALLDTLVRARNTGDVDAALACYEPDAIIVAQPGDVQTGVDSVRGVLEFIASLNPHFVVDGRTFLTADDVALHLSQWVLTGADTDGNEVNLHGGSSDVLRRQTDGSWLIAIDNPWGTALLAE